MDKLSVNQEKFCLEYAKSGNATEAYKLAGYKVKSDSAAAANAVRLLKNANVKNKLEEIRKKVESDKIMSIAEMQQRLTKIVRLEAEEEIILPNGETAMKKAGLKDALKAMELLGKMQGAFIDRSKVELSGALPVVMIDDVRE